MVFEAVHRLLSTTYARFCAAYVGGARATQFLQAAERLAVYDSGDLVALPDGSSAEEHIQRGGAPLPDDAFGVGGGGGGNEENARQGGTSVWAAANSRDRAAAMQFVSHSPWAGWCS